MNQKFLRLRGRFSNTLLSSTHTPTHIFNCESSIREMHSSLVILYLGEQAGLQSSLRRYVGDVMKVTVL